MGLEKAKITILDGQLARSTETSVIRVQFNPTQYTIERPVNYAEVAIPGLQVPLQQFVRGSAESMTLELFLDGSRDRRGIEDKLNTLRKLITIDSDLHAPPTCRFDWAYVHFTGVVTKYDENFLLFDESGRILRCKATLTFKTVKDATQQYQELNRQSPDRTKTRVVRDGERLDLIALDEYGDARMWPTLARANDLERPRHLTTGMVLTIPRL